MNVAGGRWAVMCRMRVRGGSGGADGVALTRELRKRGAEIGGGVHRKRTALSKCV